MPEGTKVALRAPAPAAPSEPAFSDDALLLTDAPVPSGPRTAQKARRGNLRVQVLRDWTELAARAAECEELAASAAEPNPFYEPFMLLPALRCFGKGVEVALIDGPHASGAKDRRELCGLFPVVRRRGRLELWRHPYCYLTAPLLRRGQERAAVAAWLDWAAGQARIVRLEDFPADSPARLALVEELYDRRWPSLVTDAYARAVMYRSASSEEFLLRALSGKRRKELRRQRSRLAEEGELVFDELHPCEDPAPWIDQFISLEAAGWKGRKGVAADRDRVFMEEMARGAAHRGKLQALALRLGEKPVALKLNLTCGEAAFAFKIAFDERFSRFSPGVQLEIENVERAHQLPSLLWMDSCAAPNRFMINHLWPDRREMQTIFFATGSSLGALAIAAVPLVHFFRRLWRREC